MTCSYNSLYMAKKIPSFADSLQLTKCALIWSCCNGGLAGLRPKIMIVALTTENTPQSVYPVCFATSSF